MHAWQITLKDLKLLCRDRYALTILLALPFAFIAILGFSTQEMLGWRDANQRLEVAVVNDDRGALSRELIEMLRAHSALELLPAIDRRAAEELLDRKYADAVLHVGPSFQRRVDQLKLADVLDTRIGRLAAGLETLDMQIIHRPTLFRAGEIARSVVYGETLRTVAPYVAGKNRLAARMLAGARRRAEEASAQPDAAPAYLSQPNEIYQLLVPSNTVLFAFFLVTIMSRSILAERDLGTLRRLRLAPVRSDGIVVGKTLPFLILSVAQTSVLLLAGRFLFAMDWGSQPWLLVPVVLCTSLAATGLGLMIATYVRTDSQVSAYATFVVLTMGGISGCLMPREFLPTSMQAVSLCTPHAWALMAYDEILTDQIPTATEVLAACAALLGFATLFFAVGWNRFRRITCDTI